MTPVLDWMGLTAEQKRAATDRGPALLVAAGAGSGKTRTLVGRYMNLLAEGISPRQIGAITFTEKAAREMRNRIRSRIVGWLAELEDDQERDRWSEWLRVMESARIGTIHSLCAEILRADPAAASLDPEFEVLDEGASALLRREAVESALVAAANDVELAGLYRDYSVWGLRRLLARLLDLRLDVTEALDEEAGRAPGPSPSGAVQRRLAAFRRSPEVAEAIGALRDLSESSQLESGATGAMAAMIEQLLASWRSFEEALEAGQAVGAAKALFEARREHMRGNVGRKDGSPRQWVDSLRASYSELVNPWLGGDRASDPPPEQELEERYMELAPLLARLFGVAKQAYQRSLEQRRALDFDGLEAVAVALLQEPSIRQEWEEKIQHLLVDEFQDTNERQRRIVDALSGAADGTLFVVGDAKQSIYRFRGAEVAVFRQLENELAAEGRALELGRTFRQHRPLLAQFDHLLPAVMPGRERSDLYQTPYRALVTERAAPPRVAEPYLEFVLGLGDDAAAGRQVAAGALAQRLQALREAGELSDWNEVALLFRASSGFGAYEDELEAYGIPYVTVAGRGFYDRPEVREALTALRALSEPWNEAAQVGFLRSVMVGMSDVGIYRLRNGEDGPRPLRQGLLDSKIALGPADEEARARAQELLGALTPRVDRSSVYDLLKALIDRSHARAALALAGQRQWGNLDKLLEDARGSQTTRVRGFLEYLEATREAGVREGEAPAEGEGALRLMTIHKAKGLEFPNVVVADAAYAGRASAEPAYASRDWGLAFQPDRWDGSSLAYQLARAEDQARDAAEEDRLLYVAATRARDKLLISGHLTEGSQGLRARGWLAELLGAVGVDAEGLEPGVRTMSGEIHCRLSLTSERPPAPPDVRVEAEPWPRGAGKALFKEIIEEDAEQTDEGFDLEPARDWRATARRYPPAPAVGVLVHRALERWLFPPEASLDRLLAVGALGEGLVDPDQRAAAIDRSKELLARFRQHYLWAEVEGSDERYHELPYTYQPITGPPDSGAFDLLYRTDQGWRLLDFKTDDIDGPDHRRSVIDGTADERGYRHQLARYQAAAQALLGEPVHTRIVFLDDQEEVTLHPIGPE